MVDEFGELDVLTFERDPWCFRDDGDIILDDYLGIRAFILKGNKTKYEKEMMQRYEEALSKIECYPNELTSALQSIHFFINLEDDEGREDDSDTQAGSVRGVGCLQRWLVKVMTTMAAQCFWLTMLQMMMTL